MATDRPAQQNEIKLLISKGLEQGYLTVVGKGSMPTIRLGPAGNLTLIG